MAFQNLLLVDGTAVLYRAFYAIPDLKTKAGEPTNAVYGFVRMMRQLIATWHPSHAAVVFDGGIPEERKTLLQTYKAQRKPMPEEMKRQMPLAYEYLRVSGTAVVRVDGHEADDVMATVARKAESLFGQVLLATSDKDMFQIVNDRINIVPISGGGACRIAMGERDVLARTGVHPSRIVEWLALTGDAADNIPGVKGVGPKKAASLLNQFGSLDELWNRTAEVSSEKLRVALEGSRDIVARNVEMIRLRTDIECLLDWDQLACRDVARYADLRNFFEKLEFRSLVNEMASSDDLFGFSDGRKDV